MKTIIVYDSKYGNTEKVAQAIASALMGDTEVVRAGLAKDHLSGVDLLVVGCPTNGGRPTQDMAAFLDAIPEKALQGVRAAAFDTRLTSRFAKIFGYAAPKIAGSLAAKGGAMIAEPEGFQVKGTKGPLAEGELERAAAWGRALMDKSGKQ